MEVGTGDRAASRGKQLSTEGLVAYVVLQVPHMDILPGRKQAEATSGSSGMQLAREAVGCSWQQGQESTAPALPTHPPHHMSATHRTPTAGMFPCSVVEIEAQSQRLPQGLSPAQAGPGSYDHEDLSKPVPVPTPASGPTAEVMTSGSQGCQLLGELDNSRCQACGEDGWVTPRVLPILNLLSPRRHKTVP